MPYTLRKRNPPTLKKCCFRSYGKHVTSIFYMEGTDSRLLTKPFDCLPPTLLQEVLTYLIGKGQLQAKHLELFVNEKTKILDIATCKEDISQFLVTSVLNYRNITYLDIRFCTVSKQAYLELANNIPNVTHLNLTSTDCFDLVLCVLGKCCPKLEKLCLDYCPFITDVGIFSLCLILDDLDIEKPRELKIHTLSLWFTNVTPSGIFLAIKSIPYLKNIYYEDSLFAFEQYIQSYIDLSNSEYKMFYLENLNAEKFAESVSNDCLTAAVKWCPLVSKLTISLQELEEGAMDICAMFKNLNCFHLSYIYMPNFSGGFYNFLKSRGNGLKELMLKHVPCDIGLLGFFCTELITLSLDGVTSYEKTFQELKNPLPFRNLEELFLSCEEPIIPATDLLMLLSNCLKLKSLTIRYMTTLTDSLFYEILFNNPLINLETVIFRECNISVVSLQKLLNRVVSLKSITCINCDNLGHMEFDIIKSHADIKGYDIEISFE